MSKFNFNEYLEQEINFLKERGLYNQIGVLSGKNGAEITISGKTMINMASNNYLGFATHPDIIDACIEATKKFGAGAGAVRTINGTMAIHEELEKEIASFKGTEAAVSFQSGFNCNSGVISAIMGKKDAILSDALNHASIIDGCRLSGAKIISVSHQDMEDLELKAKEAMESKQYDKVMYITDGVFSMDGDVAKIPEIVEIAKKYGLITYVDDAHGSGVMGNGAGTVKYFGLHEKIDIQMGTLSKALGVVGGYVAGSRQLIELIKLKARPFLFSTSLTPGAAGAALAAIKLMRKSLNVIEKLWANSDYLKRGFKQLGFDIGHSKTPITPVIIGDELLSQRFSNMLMENGVYAKAIVFPTVRLRTGRIRNMPLAIHTKEMLDKTLAIYKKVGTETGVI